MEKEKSHLRQWIGIPYLLASGMSLFPSFVFAHIAVQHENNDKYLLPLLLFYCFKMTILLLIRKRMVSSFLLLQISFLVGILGCVCGVYMEKSFYLLILSAILLGIAAGTTYPSFMTVLYHEKRYNHFSLTKKDHLIGAVYGIVFTGILFLLTRLDTHHDFLFLGCNLFAAFLILLKLPRYQLKNTVPYPAYSTVETLLLFVTGFFSMYVIKNDFRVGSADSLPILFLFFAAVLIIYFVAQMKKKYDHGLPNYFLSVLLFNGMLQNFVFVFCTFYQIYQYGNFPLYLISGLYMIGALLSGGTKRLFRQFLPQLDEFKLIALGLVVGLASLLGQFSFYFGIFILSIFITLLNRELNQDIYAYDLLPEDGRLITKYRLTNIGSMLQQIIMVGLLYFSVAVTQTISMKELFKPSESSAMKENVYLHLEWTKMALIIFFGIFISVLTILYNNLSKQPHFFLRNKRTEQ